MSASDPTPRTAVSGVQLNEYYSPGCGQPSVEYDPKVLQRMEKALLAYGDVEQLLGLTACEPQIDPPEII